MKGGVEMQKILAVSLIIIFFTTQYGYTQTAYLGCIEPDEMRRSMGFARPEPEEIEFMFDQLELNEKIELINYNETYKLKYMGAEFILVSLYDENIYLFAKKEGTLIGAVNQYDGKRNIILPQDIQPEWICQLICFLAYGQSIFSIAACLLLPIVIISYPDDQELRDALFRSCLNGIEGIIWSYRCISTYCF
jgi:hypothetical protein